MTRRPGFTIIELLIVVLVMAILLATLLPALNRVRATSSNLRCMANLSQIGIITQTYCNDFNGSYPEFFFSFGPGNSNTIVLLIKPKRAVASGWGYYPQTIRLCADDEQPSTVPVKQADGTVTYEPVSFTYNIELLLRRIRDWQVPNYAAPAGVAMFWDGSMGGDHDNATGSGGNGGGSGGGRKNIQGHYQGADDFATQTFDTRHFSDTAGNILFLDGHVEGTRSSIEPDEVLIDRRPIGQGNGGGGTGGAKGGNSGKTNSGKN